MFTDGTCCIKIDKVHGKESTKPRVGWAYKTNNKKSYCLGVHQCPHYGKGCFFRLRPRHHPRGETCPTGQPSPVRSPVRECYVHTWMPIHVHCKAQWYISTDPTDEAKWILDHNGSHNHAAPEPAGASHTGWSQLEDILTKNPSITPSKLAAGTDGKHEFPPARTIDPKLQHRGYIAYAKRSILKSHNKLYLRVFTTLIKTERQ